MTSDKAVVNIDKLIKETLAPQPGQSTVPLLCCTALRLTWHKQLRRGSPVSGNLFSRLHGAETLPARSAGYLVLAA
jgi:hypothetical protein